MSPQIGKSTKNLSNLNLNKDKSIKFSNKNLDNIIINLDFSQNLNKNKIKNLSNNNLCNVKNSTNKKTSEISNVISINKNKLKNKYKINYALKSYSGFKFMSEVNGKNYKSNIKIGDIKLNTKKVKTKNNDLDNYKNDNKNNCEELFSNSRNNKNEIKINCSEFSENYFNEDNQEIVKNIMTGRKTPFTSSYKKLNCKIKTSLKKDKKNNKLNSEINLHKISERKQSEIKINWKLDNIKNKGDNICLNSSSFVINSYDNNDILDRKDFEIKNFNNKYEKNIFTKTTQDEDSTIKISNFENIPNVSSIDGPEDLHIFYVNIFQKKSHFTPKFDC